MDRRLARDNIRFGVTLFVITIALLAATFLWAAIYLNAINK